MFFCSNCCTENGDENAGSRNAADSAGKPVQTEITGKDENNQDIVKNVSEDNENIIEVIKIENITLKGKIIVLGDANFNDLVLLTADNIAYTFRPEFKKRFWSEQGKVVTIKGKVEERYVKNKKTGKVLKKYWFIPH